MRLLRVYPSAWRARYGDELATLIEELDRGARMSWRDRVDIVRAGFGERARMLAPGGLPAPARAREGSLLVLYAWTAFIVGGFGFEKVSEHWKAVTPTAKQALPAAAFDVVLIAAAAGSALVLLGVALSLPRLAALIRAGGWAEIRRPIIRAASLSLLAVAATAGLAAWAHSLSPAARNGSDAAYSGVFLAWIVLFATCLLSWAVAAAATARRLAVPVTTLRVQVWLGATVTAAMAVITVATAVWWGAHSRARRRGFRRATAGGRASGVVSNMVVPAGLMLCATVVALIGASRAVSAQRSTSGSPKQP